VICTWHEWQNSKPSILELCGTPIFFMVADTPDAFSSAGGASPNAELVSVWELRAIEIENSQKDGLLACLICLKDGCDTLSF